MTKIKPCPFCGRRAKVERKDDRETIRHTPGCLFRTLGIFDATPQWVHPSIWNVRRKPRGGDAP